jgi:hypothetical protein
VEEHLERIARNARFLSRARMEPGARVASDVHEDLCAQAAAIAMADAALQEHRGFPLLLDVAHTVCRTNFGRDAFVGSIQAAYAARGRPMEYLSERETRS